MALFNRLSNIGKSNSRGLLWESGIAFFVRGLGATAAFLMSLVVTNSLPQAEAGYFFLGLAITAMLAPVLLFGTYTAGLRFIAGFAAENDWAQVRCIARTTWLWGGLSLLVASSVLWVSAPVLSQEVFGKPPLAEVLRVMAFSLIFIGGGFLLAYQLQAIRKVPQSIVVLSIGVPVGVAGGTWALEVSTAVDASVLHAWFGALTLMIAFYWWHQAVPRAAKTDCDKAALRSSCAPLGVLGIMTAMALWGSQLVAGAWVSAEDVAKLAVAQRTANLVSFILIAVNLVVAPRFAALYKQGKIIELRRLALRSVRIVSLCATPFVLVLFVFPERVMSLFGEEFSSAGTLLVILTIGQVVNVATGSVGFLLTMSGHERDMRNVVLLAGPFSLAAAIALTPQFGVTGAAIATALGISVQNLGAVWLVRKRLGFNALAMWQRI